MKNLKNLKNKIYIKHWQALKPRDLSSKSDLYYLKLSNEIHSNIGELNRILLERYLDDDEIKLLCCFVTCYFEDIISQTGIWDAFRKKNLEFYVKKLPFYEISESYLDEEPNLQDIAFLIWYYLNTIQQDFFLNPTNQFIKDFSENVFKIFDREYEFAPVNEKLKKFYSFDWANPDLYTTREFLQNVFFESYLLYPDINIDLTIEYDDIAEEITLDNFQEKQSYIREVTENYSYNTKSKLLALNAKEWSKAVVGKSHKHYNDIDSLSQKLSGIFIYKSQDKHNVHVEHIASGMPFKMTKKSFDHSYDLKEDDILFLGLIKWKNEWWFSGTFVNRGFDADLILDLKNSPEQRAQVNFLENQTKVEEILLQQKDSFLKFNDNSLVKFLKASEINQFVKNFFEFHNKKTLKISPKEKEDAAKRARKEGFFGENSNMEEFDKDNDPMVLFFNPKSGIEFNFNVLNAFPDPKNPYFSNEDPHDIMFLFTDPSFSKEFVHYFLDNYKNKVEFFEDEARKYILKDLDFLLRFWKSNSYHTKPTLTFTGRE